MTLRALSLLAVSAALVSGSLPAIPAGPQARRACADSPGPTPRSRLLSAGAGRAGTAEPLRPVHEKSHADKLCA